MHARFTTAVSLVAGLSLSVLAVHPSCAAPPAERPDWEPRLIGEQILPDDLVVDGAPVGELSGIDYDRRRDRWYLVSDDTSKAPARFYTADLELDDTGLHDVELTAATTILRTDGSVFPPLETDDPEVADPESIRVDQRTGTLWWSSEGKRQLPEQEEPELVDPWVRQMQPSGRHLRQLEQPAMFEMRAGERGPRHNGTFEGMALSVDGRHIVTSMEAPLFQDRTANGTLHRITFYDKRSGQPRKQIAYEADALPGNGISELLAVDRHHYLVVERNYVSGVGNSIRMYEIDTRGAKNVLRDEGLAGSDSRAVQKRLVLDMADLGLDKVDNIEAVSWGPKLSSGERTLVFVSDDNFNDSQITQIVAVAVRP